MHTLDSIEQIVDFNAVTKYFTENCLKKALWHLKSIQFIANNSFDFQNPLWANVVSELKKFQVTMQGICYNFLDTCCSKKQECKHIAWNVFTKSIWPNFPPGVKTLNWS